MSADVAALFVDARGYYADVEGVDLWPASRDARLYAGPWPVVAHPPCQLWVNFAALNFKRYGGEHNRPGNDGGCFASALASVRRWGGVLEHPASSNAFAAHGLTVPTMMGWQRVFDGPSEWVCEVWQSAYGHRARKRTWLFYSGNAPPAFARLGSPARHRAGWRLRPHQADADQAGGERDAAHVSRRAVGNRALGTDPAAGGRMTDIDAREAKLPAWARSTLATLRSAIRSLEERLALAESKPGADPSGVSIRLLGIGGKPNEHELPSHLAIVFAADGGPITVRLVDGKLVVNGERDALVVQPWVTNQIEVSNRG